MLGTPSAPRRLRPGSCCAARVPMTSRAAATAAALRRLATTFSESIGPPSTSISASATDSSTTTLRFRCHRFSSLVARSCCGGESNFEDPVATAKHLKRQMLIHTSAEAATVSRPSSSSPSTRTTSTSTSTSSSPPSTALLHHDPIAIPLHPCHQATAAAASLAARAAAEAAEAPPCDAPSVGGQPKVVRWQDGGVPLEAKERLLDQKACVVWLTGLPASGKSAVAAALERLLVARGRATALLDGDNVRHGLCSDLGFSPEDRAENVRRVGEAARLLSTGGGGLVAIAALVSPYASHRDAVRASMPEGRFVEVFVDNPLGLCEERDPKGLYRAARRGQIEGMTGLDAPYEAPERPEVVVSPCDATGGPEAAAAEVARFLEGKGLIPPARKTNDD